jgi:hypothetical protein
MQRHKKFLHLVACEVREDYMGSLIVKADKMSAYLQFEQDKESFWEYCMGKTSKSIKATKQMIGSGYRQNVWIDEEYLDAILTCNGATCESN